MALSRPSNAHRSKWRNAPGRTSIRIGDLAHMNTIEMRINGWLGNLLGSVRKWRRWRAGHVPQPADGAKAAVMGSPRPTVARGVGLGLRLGLLATLVVSGGMAAVTGGQLAWDLRTELHERQALLGESLSPLAAQLRQASNREEARAAVLRFHSSFVDRGRGRHYLAVLDPSGRVILDSGERAVAGDGPWLRASMSVMAAALGAEPLSLVVEQDSADYSAARIRRWWAWAVHVALTAVLILVLLQVVIRREVTGPIERLLAGVRKMELGYWDDMPDPGGAWEIRWLGWRFRALGNELGRTVAHLIAAQRRAYAEAAGAHAQGAAREAAASPPGPRMPEHDAGEAIGALQVLLCRLQDPAVAQEESRTLARLTWEGLAMRAERMGRPDLRVGLEDAALQVLDPDGFDEIAGQLGARRPGIEATARARTGQIRQALAASGVPVLHIGYRVKHVAGVWNKMREKSLSFDQVHDLLALRIVVPTESDCYHALGVAHDLFQPVIGRFKDYIAGPKANGYRGLHTCVCNPEGPVFEIQIRSAAMHQFAEEGAAAHANYKDGTRVPAPGSAKSRTPASGGRQERREAGR